MKVPRRFFLKGAAAGAAGTSAVLLFPLAGKAEPAQSKAELPKKWDRTTEVLIVGTGCAGLSAAIEAVRAGAEVTVLEKREMSGGDIVMSAGVFYSARTRHHDVAGITGGVSPEEFWASMERGDDDEPLNRVRDNSRLSPIYYGITKRNPEIIKRNALESASVIEFLDSYGVEFFPMNKLKPWQIVAKKGQMAVFANGMLREIRAGGAQIIMETRAESLYQDQNGAVVGLRAVNKKGKVVNIKTGSIVLATGCFIDNEYLMKRYQNYWNQVPRGFLARDRGVFHDRTGDGIIMATAVNASLEDMTAGVKLYGGPDDPTLPPLSWIIFDTQPAYMVNEKGKRITNETVSRYNGCALALLRTNSKAGYVVFDNKTFNSPASQRFSLAKLLEEKGLFTADTVPELAAAVGIDAKGLEETIATINRDAAAGLDTEFGKSGPIFQGLEAPFYISAPGVPLSYKNEGGIETNEDYQVLEHSKLEPIPGLFAAGATVGSISTRHGDCINSGRIAGRKVADLAMKARRA